MIDVLTQRLVDERSLNADKLADVLKKAHEEAESLDNALVRKGLLSEAEMLEFFAEYLGLEYRENWAKSQPDSVLGPDVRGFNSSLPVGGRYDVYEAFTEINIPLIQGVTGIENFGINGAYRYSDYSIANVGSTHTFAVGADWEVVPGFRVRGQFQRAVRAPNIGELFRASTNGFPGAQDPCSGGPNGSFSGGMPASR